MVADRHCHYHDRVSTREIRVKKEIVKIRSIVLDCVCMSVKSVPR